MAKARVLGDDSLREIKLFVEDKAVKVEHTIGDEIPSVGHNVENASSVINFTDDFKISYDSSVDFVKQGEIVTGMVGAKINHKSLSNVLLELPEPNFKMQNAANSDIEFPKIQLFQKSEIKNIVNETLVFKKEYQNGVGSLSLQNSSLGFKFSDFNEYGVNYAQYNLNPPAPSVPCRLVSQKYVDEKVADDFKILSVTLDNLTINADSRINQQPEIQNFPSGYEIVAFKSITAQKGSNATDESWKKVVIQSFSTTGGGTKPNVSLYNFGNTEAVVKLTIIVLCRKIS